MPESPPKLAHAEVHYRATTLFRRCYNCGHLQLPSACELVEDPIRAEDTCDRWTEMDMLPRRRRRREGPSAAPPAAAGPGTDPSAA
ncbi:MAG: hypothetical protein HYY85_12390 [Deltaproteobacteria bacterium]|nr:hypothetical protein [Deltaproteobacteria bacterium]